MGRKGLCRCGAIARHVLCLWCWGEVTERKEEYDFEIEPMGPEDEDTGSEFESIASESDAFELKLSHMTGSSP